jgi:dihydroorotate dehydrogenase
MPLIPYALSRPFLFALNPELAHDVTMAALARVQHTPLMCLLSQPRVSDPTVLAGLHLHNRVGLAAGLDKNGRCIDAFGAMGLGFIEVGTVTPKAQSGNPKPRMFRLPQAQGLINRLGFNNEGLDTFIANVQRSRFRSQGGILGLNIGKNASTPIEHAAQDYLLCLDGVYPHADYVAINISSPNTPHLRQLQASTALSELLMAVRTRADVLSKTYTRAVPIFVKIAPDLDDHQVAVIAQTLQDTGIDGVIATNTTIARDRVNHLRHGQETGGLSGRPVLDASNRVITQLRTALGPHYPIIGVGGVMGGEQAKVKIAAGADVVQIYTGLIYRGPELVHEVAKALAR